MQTSEVRSTDAVVLLQTMQSHLIAPPKQFSTESSESFSPTPPHTKTSVAAMFSEAAAYTTSSPRKPRRRMNEDRLGPFTDYSGRRRPPFQRSITIAAPGAIGPETSVVHSGVNFNIGASDFSGVKPSGRRDSRTGAAGRTGKRDSLGLASDLYNRRKIKALEKHQQRQAAAAERDASAKSSKRSKAGRVTFSDPPSKEPSPIPPMKMPGGGAGDFPAARGLSPQRGDDEVKVLPFSSQLDGSLLRVAMPPTSLPNIPSTSVLNQINPIVTPNRSDYTTITDEIDTTGLNYSSPSSSPTTPKGSFFRGLDVDVDLYTKKNLRCGRRVVFLRETKLQSSGLSNC